MLPELAAVDIDTRNLVFETPHSHQVRASASGRAQWGGQPPQLQPMQP